MNVESADLEARLGEYLKQIRTTGETITICDGTEPVAILAPLTAPSKPNGANLIDRLLASPWPVSNFTPLSRAEIYERK